MRFILFFLVFASVSLSQTYNWKVNRVVDGDTIEVHVDFLPKELGNKLLVRVWGVDTPEKSWRAKSDSERKLGEEASVFTKKQIQNAKDIKIHLIGWDKFGGRVLGDVIIDGINLRELLIKNGYAREYYGDKKENW